MQISYYSPMPPAPTGVADYSGALIPYLQALGPVEINPAVPASFSVPLYHIGNNALHRDIYQRALQHPGVVVIHDALLHHLYLGILNDTSYLEEFIYNYGETSRPLARQLWQERARSGSDQRYFDRPMLRRIATASRAIIVHNPAAAEIVRQHGGSAIIEIPHLFVRPDLPSTQETLQFRESLGLKPSTLLIATFGHQRETKRPAALLRAFHNALDEGVDAKLLFSGEFVSGTFERTLTPLLDHPRILRTGYLEEHDFWRYAAATDLCVNLRYPSAAESSGIAIRLMGIGKTVAFSDDAAIARLPANACLRIDTGAAEEQMLTDYIVWLAKDHRRGAEIGDAAAQHITAHHKPETIAAAYWDVIRNSRI